MSRLREAFGKEFLITSEISLPRGPNTARFAGEIAEYKKLGEKIHAVNVVDNPGSMLLMGSLPASIMLKQSGLEPIYQITGRDRNQLGIQSDLIGAAAFGIENVLALTGDPTTSPSSDHPKAKAVFDLNSVSMIKVINGMNKGADNAGKKLNKPTDFFVGAALAPGAANPAGEIKKTQLKLAAGARFFQTQVVFDAETVNSFLIQYQKKTGSDLKDKVLVGVLPLYSVGVMEFLKKIPGIIVPKKVEERIKKAKDPLKEGVAIASEVIAQLKDTGIAGAHLMPAGKFEGLKMLLDEIKEI
jgi:methylenetetrahydrofolate reductase (NADPH)